MKFLIIRNYITEVAYNVQSTVDAKHNLPINFEVTNENDSKAMGNMLEQAVEVLGHNKFTALFDKGYHTGSEFVKADGLGVEVIVAVPDIPTSSMAPDPAYNVSNFVYNKESNTFTCPQGETLVSNGKWYQKSRNHEGRKKQDSIAMQQYKTAACKTCAVYERCTKAPKSRGRVIERTAYAHLLEENKQRAKEQYTIYQRRQAIVEHPFGIIKRQWDFSYILTKQGKERASADVGLIFSAYNLRRIFTILGQNLLKKFLQELVFYFSILRSYLKRFTATFFDKNSKLFLKFNLHSTP